MKKIYFLLFCSALILGCEDKIDLDLDDPEPELVIEGYLADLDFYIPDEDLVCSSDEIITRDSILTLADFASQFDIDSISNIADYFPFNKVRLTTTAGYFSNTGTPRISNALVRLYQNGQLIETLQEDPSEIGTYPITHDPVVGALYHLEIEALGKVYETTPEAYNNTPPILFMEAFYDEDPFFDDSAAYYLRLYTYEQPGSGDHYRWMSYVNFEYVDDPGDISTASDDGIDGTCVPGSDVFGEPLELGDTIAVFQSRISQRHYDFVTSMQSQTAFVGGPFDTPPAPIVGNVKNVTDGTNAFGYFLPAAVSVGVVVVPDDIP